MARSSPSSPTLRAPQLSPSNHSSQTNPKLNFSSGSQAVRPLIQENISVHETDSVGLESLNGKQGNPPTSSLKSSILHVPTLFTFRGSVIKHTIIPCLILGLWASLIWVLNSKIHFYFRIESTLFITVTSLVLALLLGFRTNTAYERFWEGRKLWAMLLIHIRTLLRILQTHYISSHDKMPKNANKDIFNMFSAYSVALRNHCRGIRGFVNKDGSLRHEYQGLFSKIDTRPELAQAFSYQYSFAPQFVLATITRDLDSRLRKYGMDTGSFAAAMASVAAMTEVLCSVERIALTPIPIAYAVHLKQVVYMYLFLLPLQLHKLLGWITIPATIIAAFIVVGVELIGQEIENPFGSDKNDLPLDAYVYQVKREVRAAFSAPILTASDLYGDESEKAKTQI